MSEKQSKIRTRWQMLLLAIILIGFPAGSWYYLSKGFEYQLAARDQLRKTHQLETPDQIKLLKGEMPDDLMGKMFVIALLPNTEQVDFEKFGHILSQLHEQFDKPKNIQFWTIFEDKDSNFVEHFIEDAALMNDDEQLLYFKADNSGLTNFVGQLGFNETEMADFGRFPQLILVDDSLYVRRIFRSDLEIEVKQLVEVTALLLPERSKPKARVVREKEK